jgi:hypothetical protein
VFKAIARIGAPDMAAMGHLSPSVRDRDSRGFTEGLDTPLFLKARAILDSL